MPDRSIEAFDVSVLGWLTRLDVAELDVVVRSPSSKLDAQVFRPLVAPDCMWFPSPLDHLFEAPNHARAVDRHGRWSGPGGGQGDHEYDPGLRRFCTPAAQQASGCDRDRYEDPVRLGAVSSEIPCAGRNHNVLLEQTRAGRNQALSDEPEVSLTSFLTVFQLRAVPGWPSNFSSRTGVSFDLPTPSR